MSPGMVPLPASMLAEFGSRHMETIWETQARNELPQSESKEHGISGWALLAEPLVSGAPLSRSTPRLASSELRKLPHPPEIRTAAMQEAK
jgi:hypothetical protein